MSVLHIRECSFSTTPSRHSSHFAVNSSIYSVVVCSWLSFTRLFTPYCLIAGPSAFIDALPSLYALAPIPECTEARPQAAWTATAAAATSALASTQLNAAYNFQHPTLSLPVCLSVYKSRADIACRYSPRHWPAMRPHGEIYSSNALSATASKVVVGVHDRPAR